MSRTAVVLLILVAAFVAWFYYRKSTYEPPPLVGLAAESGVAYTASLRTFDDEAVLERPFHVYVGHPDRLRTLFRAEQCQNVTAAPAREAVYIFYDRLMVDGFDSSAADHPKLQFCDLHLARCRKLRSEIQARKVPLTHICSYRTPEARP